MMQFTPPNHPSTHSSALYRFNVLVTNRSLLSNELPAENISLSGTYDSITKHWNSHKLSDPTLTKKIAFLYRPNCASLPLNNLFSFVIQKVQSTFITQVEFPPNTLTALQEEQLKKILQHNKTSHANVKRASTFILLGFILGFCVSYYYAISILHAFAGSLVGLAISEARRHYLNYASKQYEDPEKLDHISNGEKAALLVGLEVTAQKDNYFQYFCPQFWTRQTCLHPIAAIAGYHLTKTNLPLANQLRKKLTP